MPKARKTAEPSEPLGEYARKRDFARTSEPGPGPRSRAKGPLTFVIQKHDATRLHYDFRLELDGVLVSWAVTKGPSLDPDDKRLAVHVEDHPLDYATFEGVIPRGQYGAGPVIVWDRGTWAPEEEVGRPIKERAKGEEEARKALAAGKLSIHLTGAKLRGSWTLVKIQRSEKDWLLIKHRDEYAKEDVDVLENDRSVLSGVTIAQLKAGIRPKGPEALTGAVKAAFPSSLTPMLATMASRPFSSPEWVFEPKLDGIRALTFLQDGNVRLVTRRGNVVTKQYPVLAEDLRALSLTLSQGDREKEKALVLDGEIVALDAAGRPSFQELQLRMNLTRPADIRQAEEQVPVVYYVFDLLHEDGYALAGVPLEQRRARLELVLPPSSHVRLVEQFPEEGETVYAAVVAHGMEGLIAKRRDSRYQAGHRSHVWLKIKATDEDDFIVCGHTRGQGNRQKTFGALLLGFHDEAGRLTYAGNVGTGFDEAKLRALRAQLDKIRSDECPLHQRPEVKDAVWVRPELVAEIKYAQWTWEGRLRAPVFVRLRPDKAPEDVRRVEAVTPEEAVASKRTEARATSDGEVRAGVRSAGFSPSAMAGDVSEPIAAVLEQLEQPRKDFSLHCQGHRIALTNLDKALWPASEAGPPVTKRDYLRYLARVSPYLLPHLKDRPLTLVRYPDGINGEKFYQRHWEHKLPAFVRSVRIYSDHNVGDTEHMVCDNLSTLLWLGQVAVLEIHSWYCRINQEPDGRQLSMKTAGSLELVDASIANYPDYLVFDLDPYIYSGSEAKGAEPELNRDGFLKTCEVALWLKELLDQLALTAFVKTTGKTGLHVFAPIVRRWDFDEVRAMCATIGQALLQGHPKEITMDWTVGRRTGKVFFDHNQNVRGKTLASIFSPRAAPEAAVSMPLSWDEVGRVYPTDFTIHTVPDLLNQKGDPWRDILGAKAELQLARQEA